MQVPEIPEFDEFENPASRGTVILMASAFLIVLVAAAVGAYFFLRTGQRPISTSLDATPEQLEQYPDFESCINDQESEIIQPSGPGEPSTCITPTGVQFVEPERILDSKFSSLKTKEELLATWETYRNDEYGFEFKYPSQKYDLVTENYAFNPSVVLLQDNRATNGVYSFAVQLPFSENENSPELYEGVETAKVISTPRGYLIGVQVATEDNIVPLILETFQATR